MLKYHNYIINPQQLIGFIYWSNKTSEIFYWSNKLLLKTVVFKSTKYRLEGPSKQRVWEDNSLLAMFEEECASNYST